MSVYFWGCGKYQALASGSGSDKWEPCGRNRNGGKLNGTETPKQEDETSLQGVLSDEIITSIACGEGHSLLATAEGEVYAFGRNNHGQCSNDHLDADTTNSKGSNNDSSCAPRKITSLDHEYIVRVDACANSSFALTDTGKVYRWGLIHTHASVVNEEAKARDLTSTQGKDSDGADNYEENAEVLGGRLAGFSGDIASVPVDAVARQDQQNALASTSTSNEANTIVAPNGMHSRQISSIVTESASQWMLAGESEAYYNELRGMGYTKEDDEDREQSRGKEYHGMLKLGVKRVTQATPQLIKSPLIDKMTVAFVAAGYSHFMLLSSCGRLFASGYNDRGQLGLGHRIGTAEIKEVEALRDYFVSRVACGQQHTLCLAALRSEHSIKPFDVGGDVYAWGQGMLGQLGIGVRGTSKGRLSPTLIKALKRYNYRSHLFVTEIACGDNFSVAVTESGVVYSWGHSEYNQHGQGSNASSDYTDPHYYFVPREVTKISTILANDEKVTSVRCGAAFSIGLTNKGNCLSWGWSAHGVLGRGKGFISSEPNVLYSFGKSAGDDRIVESYAVGTNHVVVSTLTERSLWAASKYSSLLESSKLESTADVELHLDVEHEGVNAKINVFDKLDECHNVVLLAHKVILAARSPYFQGLIKQAIEHQQTGVSDRGGRIILDITVPDVSTMKSLLNYMYTDRVAMASARSRHRHGLATLARKFGVKGLSYLSDQTTGAYTVRPASTFASDMSKVISSEAHFNDVHFYSRHMETENGRRTCIISAHKTILAHFMPYFDSMFNGGFLESSNDDFEGEASENTNKQTWISLDSFIEDGIEPSTFKKIVKLAYCGITGDDDDDDDIDEGDKVHEYMAICIGANRFNFRTLADLYERKLFACVKGSIENSTTLMEFAKSFNFPKLEIKCKNCIRLLVNPAFISKVHTSV